ncbi:MAG: 7-cyano-7-deazaguanine synthase QueC [Gammaproteobacteria bacterium]|nr:7-cyano-7-deazaguanine synthase QueC [Gammaproteobacteria bacterium]MCP5423690.1 7-cyano-7-deazaguanine synthase QueC [Gammaproteobacteria bacterium]
MPQALVVLSGGQDSTTCLYWAIARFGKEQVTTLTFDYGQRHRVELDCARRVADFAGVSNTVLPIDTFAALGGNALTESAVAVKQTVDAQTQLPNTFVPGRNLIFLTFAAAFAYPRNIRDLVGGMAQTDYSGYPDCREDTLQALQQALRLGLEFPVTLHTPLMFKSKRETVEMARDLGALEALAYTHTCYNGQRPPCGRCPACVLRAKGFAEAGLADPLLTSTAAG